MTTHHGQYKKYVTKVRAQIGKYAAANGTSEAATHFTERLVAMFLNQAPVASNPSALKNQADGK